MIIAIPLNNRITGISEDKLPIYFPSGYTIKQNDLSLDGLAYIGKEQGSLTNIHQFCQNCLIQMNVHDPSWAFSINNVMSLEMNNNPGYINFYGYISNFDSIQNKGSMIVSSYYIFSNSTSIGTFHFPNNFYNNAIFISLNSDNSVDLTGSLYVFYQTGDSVYTFTAHLLKP